MHTEGPHIQIDFVVVEHLHKRILAEVQRSDGSELHPVAARQRLLLHLDHIGLLAPATQQTYPQAVHHANILPHIQPLDDVVADGRTARGRIPAGGAVGIHDHRPAALLAVVGSDPHIEDRIGDVELDVGGIAGDVENAMWTRGRVDRCLQHGVCGLFVEIAAHLRHRHQLRRASEGIERQQTILLGQPQIGCDFGRQRSPFRLFFGQLGAQHRMVLPLYVGSVLALPALRSRQIYQLQGNVLGLSIALGAAVAHQIPDDLIAEHELVAAILQDEPRALRGPCRALYRARNVHGTTLLRRERRARRQQQDGPQAQSRRGGPTPPLACPASGCRLRAHRLH